jgi:hypothetical protein
MPAVARTAIMGRKKLPESTVARITVEAINLARIASGYTGETVGAYISRITAERARSDIDRLHAQKFTDHRVPKKDR